jgi:hypothetical protein
VGKPDVGTIGGRPRAVRRAGDMKPGVMPRNGPATPSGAARTAATSADPTALAGAPRIQTTSSTLKWWQVIVFEALLVPHWAPMVSAFAAVVSIVAVAGAVAGDTFTAAVVML